MEKIQAINKILSSFQLKAQCINHNIIENYEYYDLSLNPGEKIKDILKFSNEISMALKMPGKLNHKIIHEQGLLRLESLKKRENILKISDNILNIISQDSLNLWLGKNYTGKDLVFKIPEAPHTLIAGTTGSGKSVLLHNIIFNILINSDAQLYLLDPKMIEFNKFSSERIQVHHSYEDALYLVSELIESMETRYKMIRDGISINSICPSVLIIDEFSDLIYQDKDKKLHDSLCKLAQKCRAAKIYIIIATQRPSVDVISGLIKANFPARISCKVANHFDSKVILDESGAENLIGHGDAYIKDIYNNMERFQIAYVSKEEVKELI